MAETWSRCSSCKSEIPYLTTYWVCSVSTCTRKRTGMVFCSVGCWEIHLPMMRHREAYAVEERSPSRQQHLAELAAERDESGPVVASAPRPPPAPAPRPRPATVPGPAPVPVPASAPAPAPMSRTVGVEAPPQQPDQPFGEADMDEVLVVVSKLKKYIKDRSGYNTSDGVVEALSNHLRKLCDAAARNAARDGRKTVMERDFIMLTQAVERGR